MSLQKPIEKITKVTRLKPGFVGTALVLLITALALFIVFAIGVKLTNELKSFAQYLTQRVNDIPAIVTEVENWLLRVISFLPDSLEQAAANFIRKYAESIRVPGVPDSSLDLSWLKSPLGSVWETAKQILNRACLWWSPSFLRFMATSYMKLRSLSTGKSAGKGKKLSQLKPCCSALGKMAKAYCLLMLITFSKSQSVSDFKGSGHL